jgi:hypothetical protein
LLFSKAKLALSKKQNLLSKASFAFAKATTGSHFFDDGKVSSVAILSMRDNVKHTKMEGARQKSCKNACWIIDFQGKEVFN